MTRSEQLATDLEQFNQEMLSFLHSQPGNKWQAIVAGEEWPVSQVMYHIIAEHYSVMSLIKRSVRDEPLLTVSKAFVEARNQDNAAAKQAATPEQLSAMLEKHGQKSADFIRALSDDQLNQTIDFGPIGNDVPLDNLVQLIILHSAREHFDHVLTTVNG